MKIQRNEDRVVKTGDNSARNVDKGDLAPTEDRLGAPIITQDVLRREQVGNRRLTWLVVALAVLAIALAASLIVYLSRNAVTPQTVQDVSLVNAQNYLESHPKESTAYEALASAQVAQGSFDEALKTLQVGISETKEDMLYLPLGDVFREKKDYAQAISSYDRAESARREFLSSTGQSSSDSSLAPKDQALSQILYGRALAEIASGNEGKAKLDLQAAAASYPTSAMVWSALGDIYAVDGDKEAATQAYREALKYIPDYKPAQAGLDRLEGGE